MHILLSLPVYWEPNGTRRFHRSSPKQKVSTHWLLLDTWMLLMSEQNKLQDQISTPNIIHNTSKGTQGRLQTHLPHLLPVPLTRFCVFYLKFNGITHLWVAATHQRITGIFSLPLALILTKVCVILPQDNCCPCKWWSVAKELAFASGQVHSCAFSVICPSCLPDTQREKERE